MNSEVSFVTFGAGAPVWNDTANRLGKSALRSGLFSSVEVGGWKSFQRNHPKFCERHASMLQSDVRGFGYWVWKPLLIRSALERSSGFVLYLDGGCMLNLRTRAAKMRLQEYVEMARTAGAVTMQMEHPEWHWNKADTVERLGLTVDHLESGQISASMLLLRKSSEIVDLLDAWLEIALESSSHFVDDSPSRLPERRGFREHRHDQAIVSGLVKVAGINSIPDETHFGPNWFRLGSAYPVWTTRLRGESDLRLQLRLAKEELNATLSDGVRWLRKD